MTVEYMQALHGCQQLLARHLLAPLEEEGDGLGKTPPPSTELIVAHVISIIQEKIVVEWLPCFLQVLRILEGIVNGRTRGGAIVHALWGAVHLNGFPKSRRKLLPVFADVWKVFVNRTVSFVSQGLLLDPHAEFFIQSLQTSVDGEADCVRGDGLVSVRYSMIPLHVMSVRAVNGILFIGKVVAVLNQSSSKEIERLREDVRSAVNELCASFFELCSSDRLLELVADSDSGDGLQPFTLPALSGPSYIERIVDKCRSSVSEAFWTFIIVHGRLPLHLQVFRNFFLLGNGEFFQAFLDIAREYLDTTSKHDVEALGYLKEVAFEHAMQACKLEGSHSVSHYDVGRSFFQIFKSLSRDKHDTKSQDPHQFMSALAQDLGLSLVQSQFSHVLSEEQLNVHYIVRDFVQQKDERGVLLVPPCSDDRYGSKDQCASAIWHPYRMSADAGFRVEASISCSSNQEEMVPWSSSQQSFGFILQNDMDNAVPTLTSPVSLATEEICNVFEVSSSETLLRARLPIIPNSLVVQILLPRFGEFGYAVCYSCVHNMRSGHVSSAGIPVLTSMGYILLINLKRIDISLLRSSGTSKMVLSNDADNVLSLRIDDTLVAWTEGCILAQCFPKYGIVMDGGRAWFGLNGCVSADRGTDSEGVSAADRTHQYIVHASSLLYSNGEQQSSILRRLQLAYVPPSPINLIVDEADLDRYNLLFRFLLETKKVQTDLHHTWPILMCARRVLMGRRQPSGVRRRRSKNTSTTAAFRLLIGLRALMQYWIDNLQLFLQMDILDSSFQQLLHDVDRTRDFHAVRRIHKEYLTRICKDCFQFVRFHVATFHQVFQLCNEFCRLITQHSDDGGVSIPLRQIMNIRRQFVRQTCFMYAMLMSQVALQSSPKLSHFLYRMDYNDFYSKLASQPSHGVPQSLQEQAK